MNLYQMRNEDIARHFINYAKINFHSKDRVNILGQLFSQYLKYIKNK